MSDNQAVDSKTFLANALLHMLDELSEDEIKSLEDFIVNECEDGENIFRNFILG